MTIPEVFQTGLDFCQTSNSGYNGTPPTTSLEHDMTVDNIIPLPPFKRFHDKYMDLPEDQYNILSSKDCWERNHFYNNPRFDNHCWKPLRIVLGLPCW